MSQLDTRLLMEKATCSFVSPHGGQWGAGEEKLEIKHSLV